MEINATVSPDFQLEFIFARERNGTIKNNVNKTTKRMLLWIIAATTYFYYKISRQDETLEKSFEKNIPKKYTPYRKNQIPIFSNKRQAPLGTYIVILLRQ
jgi:hypothetical protein